MRERKGTFLPAVGCHSFCGRFSFKRDYSAISRGEK